MNINRLSLTILATMLCLSGVSQQTGAQQPTSGSSKVERSADASLDSNLSNLLARVWRGRRSGFSLMPSTRSAGASRLSGPATAASRAVHGDGTVGKISMWVGTHPSGSSTLGDSIITQLNDNIGIGLSTPMSKLGVQGMIETTLGGYKFPDGTVQTTAAVSGLQLVVHDSTLTGDGTSGSPLGVNVPLVLTGSAFSNPILSVTNTAAGGGVGVLGRIDDGGGVVGLSVNSVGVSGASRNGNGVEGFTQNSDPFRGGVSGFCQNCNGLMGQGKVGVRGLATQSDEGAGVLGTGTVGVQGEGVNIVGLLPGGTGVLAKGGNSSGAVAGNGVVATGGNRNGRGVVATGGIGSVGYGVEATGGASTGSGSTAGAGLFAKGGPSSGSNSQSGFGIIATAGDATDGATRGRAAAFEGEVTITDLTVFGSLDVQGTKNFKIDHPLDPENKYLRHASVESSEVLNVYSGNIITDSKGEAAVTLPDWFEALNRDLRYQLTVIGTFAQAIVANEARNNRFTIKTSAPNVKVSWQVTGVRSDRAMQKEPFHAEEHKPERERGHYLQPELYNQPEERGVEWALNPEMMQKLKQQRLEAQKLENQPKQIGR